MSKCLGHDISVRHTLKVSIELPATSRHHSDMTERLLKGTLSPNQTNKTKSQGLNPSEANSAHDFGTSLLSAFDYHHSFISI